MAAAENYSEVSWFNHCVTEITNINWILNIYITYDIKPKLYPITLQLRVVSILVNIKLKRTIHKSKILFETTVVNNKVYHANMTLFSDSVFIMIFDDE